MTRPPTDQQAADRMAELAQDHDIENRHSRMDDYLCELLIYHGYHETVRIYQEAGKWYE